MTTLSGGCALNFTTVTEDSEGASSPVAESTLCFTGNMDLYRAGRHCYMSYFTNQATLLYVDSPFSFTRSPAFNRGSKAAAGSDKEQLSRINRKPVTIYFDY